MASPAVRMVPGLPAPALRPRVGTEPIGSKGGVNYLPLRTRSLLNRCSSPQMPFEWTVNPYRGCAMGCRYCYAAYTHEFLGRGAQGEFHDTVFVKQPEDGRETLAMLQGALRRGERVALGTVTDPYQPAEASFGVTRRWLEVAAQLRGLRLSITTKGALVLRDLDLLQTIAARSELQVQVSLISPHAELLRKLEPWAPSPAVRFEMIERLSRAGLDVALFVAPVLPGITDATADLAELVGAARRHGARRVLYSVLFLRSPTREAYLAFVQREFPHLSAAYERAYAGRVYLGGAYRARVRATLQGLCRAQGFAAPRRGDPSAPRTKAQQLTLFH